MYFYLKFLVGVFLTEFLSRSNNFWKTRPLTLGHSFQNFKFSLC